MPLIYSQHQYYQNQTEFNISICTNGTLFKEKYYHSVDVIRGILDVIQLATIVIGIIANILVLSLTTLDKTLHKPTFTAIGALSVAALFCLCSLLFAVFKNHLSYSYDILMLIFSISSLHVLLIAFVRYIILVHPFVARNHLSCKKIILSSFLCYVIAIFITLTVLAVAWDYLYVFIISIFTYYVPFIMTAIFHAVKYYKMKQQARRFNRNVDQMERVVVVIIATSCILPLPRIVFNAFDNYVYYVRRSLYIEINLSFLSFILMTLNVLNPFLYCFLSKSLRDSFKSLCCKCRC